MHDANQLFISHADQPADAPAAGCDTIDEQTIFDLDEEEAPVEEEEDDEGAAAPSSSTLPTGAAIKHKRTMDKFLALPIVYGKGPRVNAPRWKQVTGSANTLRTVLVSCPLPFETHHWFSLFRRMYATLLACMDSGDFSEIATADSQRIWCGMATATKSSTESCLTLGGAQPLHSIFF